jgi:large subunit ribosomal protein L9
MKIILQKDYPSLGDAGDIKEVSDGFARNFLIPQKYAIRADVGSTKAALHHKKLVDLKKDKRKKTLQGLADSLKDKEIEVFVKVGENDKLFGSVTHSDVSQALKTAGFEIDKRKIEFPENIKSIGSYNIKIKLAEGIVSQVKLKVSKAS